jgi:hypothetical protein
MAEALPKVRSAPHPLPFVIKADVIDVEQGEFHDQGDNIKKEYYCQIHPEVGQPPGGR